MRVRFRVLVSEVLVLVVRDGSLKAAIAGLIAQVRGLVSRISIRPAQNGLAAVSVQSSVAAIEGVADWVEGLSTPRSGTKKVARGETSGK